MKTLSLLLLIVLTLISCENAEIIINNSEPLELKAGMEVKVEQDNQFSFELLRQVIATNETEKNIFISPLSVSIALGMARNGAAGSTLSEIDKALFLDELTNDQINEYYKILLKGLPKVDYSTKINLANSIWYKEGFPIKNDFLKVNAEYFDAEIDELNFDDPNSVNIINDWCAEKTNDLIKEPLNEISADALMYLINAIYFKGSWANPFDPESTYTSFFKNEDGIYYPMDMMQIKDSFEYFEDTNTQYVRLPYGNGSYNMTILLPEENTTVKSVIKDLNTEKWKNIQSNLTSQELKLFLPKFKVECKFELKEAMRNMGMNTAFTNLADFSKISDYQLFISRIIHSTYCEVNEEGTEAAAVTIIEFENTSIPNYPVVLINRPFAFIISEKTTGAIIFASKIGEIKK